MDDMDKGRRRLIRLENVDVLARVIPIGQSGLLQDQVTVSVTRPEWPVSS
ncbi:Uncharacterised protein [Mycobacteroides abscessus subsp. abscessus]|nr:Uncharacterised protein [Mycobacteroides abscessus subsp. abscessus]SHZ59718.1 Uncharacterised protein [Mycobacteroides abscessus subsp. abscessus]SIA23825.1 Uncharacterised protein [Mycobacteroides abscessus subsp. abscessus]SIC20367.1 Uncharacterised protein [Mycobacteroides abscessus subsp. abscessus]SIC74455.1 Uncharacterised protein [Mycobacteroides abscessus subsp. abscessus]